MKMNWLIVVLIVLVVGYILMNNTNLMENFSTIAEEEVMAMTDLVCMIKEFLDMNQTKQNSVLQTLTTKINNSTNNDQKTNITNIKSMLTELQGFTQAQLDKVFKDFNLTIMQFATQ